MKDAYEEILKKLIDNPITRDEAIKHIFTFFPTMMNNLAKIKTTTTDEN
jgi:hypothetical protein